MERREVVIVGGGPAGAAVAIGLARRGRDVLVLERSPAWRWRACGVFTSPVTVTALRRLGLTSADLAVVARPVPAMRVETPSGIRFRLTYGDDGSLRVAAVGLDRSVLDPLLLRHARDAGAEVREGVTVRRVDGRRVTLAEGRSDAHVEAGVLVGADGIRSLVARSNGVARGTLLGRRTGLTFHVEDPAPDTTRDARMVVFDNGYVGLAPVPAGRVNVGIVVGGRQWAERLRRHGAATVVAEVLARVPASADDPVGWPAAARCDPIAGVSPLGHRVTRRHGHGWLLVGDAIGFLDPFTGEGLHRALRSAAIAAIAIDAYLGGDRAALPRYDRALTARFRSKDVVSLVVQGFLGRPALFERAARGLAGRPALRETMGLVMGDLVPASGALDPRFVIDLLRP